MTLSSSQQAALRAKKALANGDTSFKPRGEKNKAAFEALKSNGVSAESPPTKKMKITTASSSSSSSSPHTSDLASLLDFNPENITNTSDEEEEEKEEQDDAMLAKIKAHREQIKKRELHMKSKLSKQKPPSGPYIVRLPPKTKAQLLMEKEEDMKNERHQRSTQIFKLAYQGKQFDVLTSKYKEFDKPEDLLEWLQDVVEQKELGFEIEDDDSREAAWLQEKADRKRKGLHTNMSDHKAKQLFFEYNKFLLFHDILEPF